jgi:hypothetical protein
VLLELDDVGTLSWLFQLPENAVASPQSPPGGAAGAGNNGDTGIGGGAIR